MPNLKNLIDEIVAGDDIALTMTITSVPPGDTLAKAWMTVKAVPTDADPGVFQKVILPGFVSGQGQITDTGASGTGIVRFDLTAANTLLLTPGVIFYYDVKMLTAGGKVGTPESGAIIAKQRITVVSA